MKNKIARRLTLYFALVLLFFALLVGLLFSFMFARHTAAVMAHDLRAHADSIAGTLTQFNINLCRGECEGGGFNAYMRFVGDFAMSDIYLLDSQCRPVSLGKMSLSSAPLPDNAREVVQDVFEEQQLASFVKGSVWQGKMIAGAPVLNPDGSIQAALLLCSPVGSSSHALRDAFIILAACLTIAMLLAIAASNFLSHRFVTPLNRMMETTTRLMDGDYSAATGIRQDDEIGTLATHIDALSLQLDAAEKERSALSRERQDFLSDISHELRTPISVIKGNIELLRDGVIRDDARRQECFDQLHADVQHIARLVNDMLELTRLQSPQFRIDMEPLNLIDVLEETMRAMRQSAAAKKITLRFDNRCGPVPVMGDYSRLRQLMTILTDNAIKFSPDASVVEIIAERTKDGCTVIVSDRGVGIEEEALHHIFDRYFHQRSSLNRSGTGLGLPIAREISLRHGVSIICESKVGEGTRFTLTFPECEIPQ